MTNRLRPIYWHTNDPDTKGVVVLLDGVPLVNVIEADVGGMTEIVWFEADGVLAPHPEWTVVTGEMVRASLADYLRAP